MSMRRRFGTASIRRRSTPSNEPARRVKRVERVADLRETVATFRSAGSAAGPRPVIGFVPTMGYLHEGHLSLVDRARELADRVVVSVFVNPLQFGEGEDYEDYPRDERRDVRLAEERAVDVFFTPGLEELYPHGEPEVRVEPGPMADRLCGAYRPGHFSGVLTIVAKLFNLVQPDVAVFGRKDYQQGVLIRAMVRDLDFPIRVELASIVRDEDGLALSSRNRYLSAEQRRAATSLPRGLRHARDAFRKGERNPEVLGTLLRRTVAEAMRESPVELQYAEVVHPDSLEPVSAAEEGSVFAAAAFVGDTRLIDNVILD